MMNKKKISSLLLIFSLTCALITNMFYVDASKKVSLNKKSITLKIGKKYKLRVKNTKKKVKWKSNNKHIAKINSKGIVKAVKAGKTRVYAKVSGKKLYCKIIVKKEKIQNTSNTTSSATATATPTSKKNYYNFRYPSYLTEHYNKHGVEMGYTSEKAYLDGANALINNAASLHKLEAEDSDHIYYLEATNEIVFLSQDGFIRTYFICSGKAYFDRQ